MKHEEDALTIQVAEYLTVACPDLLWFHVPNGGKRNAREAARFKKMGVLPGVADFVFISEHGQTDFIELKAEGAYQRPAQKAFEQMVKARGCDYVVCRSLEDVQETLTEWGVAQRVSA